MEREVDKFQFVAGNIARVDGIRVNLLSEGISENLPEEKQPAANMLAHMIISLRSFDGLAIASKDDVKDGLAFMREKLQAQHPISNEDFDMMFEKAATVIGRYNAARGEHIPPYIGR